MSTNIGIEGETEEKEEEEWVFDGFYCVFFLALCGY